MSADTSDLLRYASHLDHVVDRIEEAAGPVIERGGMNVKRSAQEAIRGQVRGQYLRHYPRSITYEMVEPLAVEIGPDSAKPQGGMGRGVEFGSANTPPMPHLLRSGEDEGPNLEKHLADVVLRVMR